MGQMLGQNWVLNHVIFVVAIHITFPVLCDCAKFYGKRIT